MFRIDRDTCPKFAQYGTSLHILLGTLLGMAIAPTDGQLTIISWRQTMWHSPRKLIVAAILTATALTSLYATAHGNVTPQGVDTTGLPALGDKWRDENPFKTNKLALKIGTSAYNQNCARCHGIEAVSGGIAPDLRQLDRDCVGLKNEAKKAACYKEMDVYYLASVRQGKVRNGAVYMPPFEGVFNQEAMWAIKTYLESRRETK